MTEEFVMTDEGMRANGDLSRQNNNAVGLFFDSVYWRLKNLQLIALVDTHRANLMVGVRACVWIDGRRICAEYRVAAERLQRDWRLEAEYVSMNLVGELSKGLFNRND